MSAGPPPELHPLGRPLETEEPGATCGDCAWSRLQGPGPRVLRCVAAPARFTSGGAAVAPRVEAAQPACDRWQEALDCLDCAACCGPAYDVVEVAARDPVRRLQPDWIVREEGRWQVRRTEDNFCLALQADNCCEIYGDRPRCCRDFERGGSNCLIARRRLGFSLHWR